MELVTLRDEYDLARQYTQSLYEDLPESDVQWRPKPKSSAIAWHLGHQAVVNHFLLRNLFDAEPSIEPRFDALFDAAQSRRKPRRPAAMAGIVAYRAAVAARTHARLTNCKAANAPPLRRLRIPCGPCWST